VADLKEGRLILDGLDSSPIIFYEVDREGTTTRLRNSRCLVGLKFAVSSISP